MATVPHCRVGLVRPVGLVAREASVYGIVSHDSVREVSLGLWLAVLVMSCY